MNREKLPILHTAVRTGDIETVRRVFKEDPELMDNRDGSGDTWLKTAAWYGQLEIAEFLVATGFDVKDGWPLNAAVTNEHTAMARWLLDRGAKIEQTSERGGGTIIGAAHRGPLEMVQLLLDHGADPNATFGSPPRNALSDAEMFGHTEIAEFLRAHGAIDPPPNAPEVDARYRRDEVFYFMDNQYGRVAPLALTEIVPLAVPISINMIRPNPQCQYLTLFTIGMSDRPMTVPEGGEDYRFAELVIFLPPDWPLTDAALKDPNNCWPIDWMRKIARYPHEENTWLCGRHAVIANGDPPEPFAPNTKFTCMLLVTSQSESGVCRLADDKLIQMYTMFPLYTEERDLELAKGPLYLLEAFERLGIETAVDLRRPNVATELVQREGMER